MALRRTTAHAALSLLVLAGCDAPGFGSKAKSPAAPMPIGLATTTSASAGGRAEPLGPQVPSVFTPGLSISDRIAKACGIAPRTGASVNPSFDYDSTTLGESDRQMLGEVARCLTEGALKGKPLTLIGRADARGEDEYNMTLGESRATTVQRYLVDLGVGRDRMKPTSRGEIDAVGKDESGYAQDRRVDIELAL